MLNEKHNEYHTTINLVDMMSNLVDMIKNDQTNEFIKKIQIYYSSGFDPNTKDEYGNTLIHIACRKRNYQIVKELIDKYDAKVDIKNDDGRTALHFATIYGAIDGAYFFDPAILTNILNTMQNKKGDSQAIILKIINKNRHTMFIEDNDSMDPMNYFSIYSEIGSINSDYLSQVMKNYKRVKNFLKLLKDYHMNNPEQYELAISIFFGMTKK
jgi:ankyrin repeat protein